MSNEKKGYVNRAVHEEDNERTAEIILEGIHHYSSAISDFISDVPHSDLGVICMLMQDFTKVMEDTLPWIQEEVPFLREMFGIQNVSITMQKADDSE